MALALDAHVHLPGRIMRRLRYPPGSCLQATGVHVITDQIFGICQLLGFRYAPRIRDLADKRLHPFEKAFSYPTLEPLIGDRINVGQIESQWDELLRLATSIRQGTVTA